MNPRLVLLLFGLICMLRLPAQNVTVTGAAVGNGSYATLGAAFAAIQLGNQSGKSISVQVLDTTVESGTALLSNSNWSSLVVSSGGGAVTGNFASPLVNLYNVRNVNFQGISLYNYSTSASGASTIAISGSCSLINISGCSIFGSGQSSSYGTVQMIAGGMYNDRITISSCSITAVPGTTHACGINADYNAFVNISSNTISNFFVPAGGSQGIFVGPGNLEFTITNNIITQDAIRTHTVGGRWSGIVSHGGHTISGNTISGFSLIGAGPQSRLIPIVIWNGGSAGNSDIDSNRIEHMSISGPVSGVGELSPFIGILHRAGTAHIGVNGGNFVGSDSISGNIQVTSTSHLPMDVYGIYAEAGGSVDVFGTTIGGITVTKSDTGAVNLHGIRCATRNTRIQGNVVGLGDAPLLLTSPDSSSSLVGISLISGGGDISANTVSHLQCDVPNPHSGSNAGLIGIKIQPSVLAIYPSSTVYNNKVFALTSLHASVATSTVGVSALGIPSRPITIGRQNIYALDLSTSSQKGSLVGIYLGGGKNTLLNSFVRLGLDSLGTSITNVGDLFGILDDGGKNSYYNNSVYVGGGNVAGTASSATFFAHSDPFPKELLNNIFYNGRSNGFGIERQYVFKMGAVDSLISDYNLLFAPGGGGVLAHLDGVDFPNLVSWLAFTNQDSHSIERDPGFLNPSGSLNSGDLHLGASSPAEGVGLALPVVSEDIDGAIRIWLTPVDIGADAGNFQPVSPSPAEIAVRGHGVNILDGTQTISSVNGTAIDTIRACEGTVEEVFWIENQGDDSLVVSLIEFVGPDSSQFEVSFWPSMPLAPQQWDSFGIRFVPFQAGNHHAMVTIHSNDSDEDVFDFRVGGFTLSDTAKPFVSCKHVTITLPPSGTIAVISPWVVDSSYDACGIDTFFFSQRLFGCADIGIQPLVVRAQDFAGNIATCTTSVEVLVTPFTLFVESDTSTCGYDLRCFQSMDGRGEAHLAGGCAPYRYAWSNGDTMAVTRRLGRGVSTVTVTDANGQMLSDSVVLSAPPPLLVELNDMVQSCFFEAGGALSVGAIGGHECASYKWQWDSGDTLSSAFSLAAGTYHVTVTDIGGCQAFGEYTVTPFTLYIPNIRQHLDTLLCTAPFLSYQWYRDGQAIPYMRDPFLVPDTSGTYHVEVRDASGCVGMSNVLWMTSIRHIPQGHHLDNLVLAPNPAQGYVTLVAGDPVRTGVRVGFYDASGRLVRKLQRPDLEDEWTIDIHGLSAGIYFLNVSANNGAYKVLRLVVQD